MFPLHLVALALAGFGLFLTGGCSGDSDMKIYEGVPDDDDDNDDDGDTTAADLLWSAGKLFDEMKSNPDLVVLDCRQNVADALGVYRRPYDAEHITGAYYLDFFAFGDPYPDDLARIVTTLSALGITTDTPICLYDEPIANPQGKIFFNLERLGCTDVHLLDGGIYAWKQVGGAVTDAVPPARTPSTFVPEIDNRSYAKLADMKAIYDLVDAGATNRYTLTDFREPDLFYGHKICPDAERHGRIPHTNLLDWHEFFDSATGLWKSPAALEALCRNAGLDRDKINVLICNKGWRTGISYFTLRYLGWPKANLIHYVGGVREWAAQDPVTYPLDSDACWEVGKKLPPGNASSKRFAGAFAQVDSKVYCIGGYLVTPTPGTPTNRHQAYDIVSNTWTDLAPLPGSLKLTFSAGAGVGYSVYVLGGLDQDGAITDRIYRYNTVANTWDDGTVETPLPVGLFSFAAARIGDRIYVCGGLTSKDTSVTANYSASVFAYDTVTRTWDESLPDLPRGRRCHSMVALGNKLYVLGGFYFDDVAEQDVDLRDIWALDTTAPVGWVRMADLPMDIAGHAAAVANDNVKDRIYTLGAWSMDGITNDVIEFDPDANTTRILKVDGHSACIGWPRYWYFIGSYREKIASIGGFGSSPGNIATAQNSGFSHFQQTYVYDVTNHFDP
jgi:thiosulfate/3-mercaptopyruvate sulfurtransferase